jgi:hypothetical protein
MRVRTVTGAVCAAILIPILLAADSSDDANVVQQVKAAVVEAYPNTKYWWRNAIRLQQYSAFTDLRIAHQVIVLRPGISPDQKDQAVAIALGLVGQGYRYSVYWPKGPSTFDCSGLTEYVYEQVGLNITPDWLEEFSLIGVTPDIQLVSAKLIGDELGPIPAGQLQKGDLVFRNTIGFDVIPGDMDHVGIVVAVDDDLANSVPVESQDLWRNYELGGDRIDNNGNGLIDEMDPNCYWPPKKPRISRTCTRGLFMCYPVAPRIALKEAATWMLVQEYNFDGGNCAPEGWTGWDLSGHGDLGQVESGVELIQADACNYNSTCLWDFIAGSTFDYACGAFPAQNVIPYENDIASFVHTAIVSPPIAWTASSGSGAVLQFDVLADLTLNALVFYQWFVRSGSAGEWGAWKNGESFYYEPSRNGSWDHGGQPWLTVAEDIGALLEPGVDSVQIALGVADMYEAWNGILGNGTCHSHAPAFDNVKLFRSNADGPQWRVYDEELFQDNFASDGTLTGTVRADMAADIIPRFSPGILAGDSAVVTVCDPTSGIGFRIMGNPSSGPAVYCYLTVKPDNQPFKTGVRLIDDTRYTYVDSLVDAAGNTWHQIQMDSVYYPVDGLLVPVPDKYCVDLNDTLFTPRDTVFFFFGAKSESGIEGYWSKSYGTTGFEKAAASPMEFTCLPANALNGGTNILYVDANDRGDAQYFFDTAFEMLAITPDRYDVRAPSSISANGLGSRVINCYQQLLGVYKVIIWDTGDLAQGTIGDWDNAPSKSPDADLLYNFLDFLDAPGGVYLSGDNLASELAELSSGGAANLRSTYVTYNVVASDHTSQVGISPIVVGESASPFTDAEGPDTLIAFGGCPTIGHFDVITPTGTATQAAQYTGSGGSAGAIVTDTTLNALGVRVGVILSGFSYSGIRDDVPSGLPDRVEHLQHVLQWLNDPVPIPTAVSSRGSHTALLQNYPNPFNPTTTIGFSIKHDTDVELKIYNVRGALVKTLVNGYRVRNIYKEIWDGKDNTGQSVASGVYFYKLITGDFRATKKMVLLR